MDNVDKRGHIGFMGSTYMLVLAKIMLVCPPLSIMDGV